jgi:hypothetical protein
MNMDAFFIFLSHLVLFLSLSTVVFAFGAYAALALRRRRPLSRRRKTAEVTLIRRYVGDPHD